MGSTGIIGLSMLLNVIMLLSIEGMMASPLGWEMESTTTTTASPLGWEMESTTTTTEQACGPNSQHRYDTICPETCDNLFYIANTICFASAVEGCFCDDGYVFESDESERCVLQSECKISCPQNAHYEERASGCQENCWSPNPETCEDHSYAGCVCDAGYIFSYMYPYNSSTVCIPRCQCPGK